MTKDESGKVYDYFESCSRNLTPASARNAADLLYAPFYHDPEVTKLCSSILTDCELLRADRFVLEADKERFVQRRAFRRFCGAKMTNIALPLSQIVFEETIIGRPYLAELPDIWFSFSSCKLGFLGAQSTTHGIGVDLEDKSRNLEAMELAQQFFSKNEVSIIEQVSEPDRLRFFLELWCLKEAALKSIGEGLPFGLDVFQFELEPVLRVIQSPAGHSGPDSFSAHLIEINNVCAALVLRNFA
jgi:phosphopantetheine--protein transferase-like protein